jgi:hypothetical protein
VTEESRLGLVGRVASALLGLESLSDGKTAKIDPNRVHGGEQDGIALLRDKSPYEFHASELLSWCERAELRTENERRRIPQPMTPLEEDFWFRQYEGTDYRSVANKENIEPMDVWRKRERMGLNPQDGREIERAA